MRGKTFEDVGASRASHFDILRLLLAILVIFHPSYSVLYKGRTPGTVPTEPLELLTRGRADLGSAAVYGFFIISGFLITASWIREPRVGAYLKKRVLRIYPAFIAMMAFCLLVAAPLGAVDPAVYWHGVSVRDVLSSVFRLQMPATPGVFVDTPARSLNVSV
jgi:peptidoglycan/LPS O-acetylase OafA/YrhL